MATTRQRIVILGVVTAAALIGLFLPAALTNTSREKQARLAATTAERTGIDIGGPFELVDQNGQRVTESSWPRKVRLLFFGFTHCPDICPTTLTALSGLIDDLGEAAADVVPILVTVDPERDSAAVLKDYVASFHPHTVALTGTPPQIEAVLRSFGAYAKKVPLDGGGYTMDHAANVYLLDRAGKFRGTLDLHEDRAAWRQKVERVLASR